MKFLEAVEFILITHKRDHLECAAIYAQLEARGVQMTRSHVQSFMYTLYQPNMPVESGAFYDVKNTMPAFRFIVDEYFIHHKPSQVIADSIRRIGFNFTDNFVERVVQTAANWHYLNAI